MFSILLLSHPMTVRDFVQKSLHVGRIFYFYFWIGTCYFSSSSSWIIPMSPTPCIALRKEILSFQIFIKSYVQCSPHLFSQRSVTFFQTLHRTIVPESRKGLFTWKLSEIFTSAVDLHVLLRYSDIHNFLSTADCASDLNNPTPGIVVVG